MPNSNPDFGVAVTCIDGRTHEPITRWVRQHAGVHYVDLVTEPGADATLADCPQSSCDSILRRLGEGCGECAAELCRLVPVNELERGEPVE